MPDGTAELSIEDTEGQGIDTIAPVKLEELSIEEESSNTLRLSLLQGTLRMLERYLQLYASTPAFLEVFEDALHVVSKLTTVSWHSELEVKKFLIVCLLFVIRYFVLICKIRL